MKIHVHFYDGNYSYSRVEDNLLSRCHCGQFHAHIAEVPAEVVALWDAISQSVNEMQKQLGALDNAWYDEHEKKHCERCGERTPVRGRSICDVCEEVT